MKVRSQLICHITAPRFVAGVMLDGETRTVHRAAPIVHYMLGWPLHAVIDYCNRKHWSWWIDDSLES